MGELESGGRLSTAVGASGRRARRDLRVLWCVAVVTLLGVLVSLQLDERSSIDHTAIAAGAAELEELSTYDARAAVLSFQLTGQPDLRSAHAVQIGSLTVAARTDAAGTWARFAARPPRLPGEREVRERYESLVSAGDAWASQVAEGALEQYAADPAVRDAAVSALSDRLLQQAAALGDLRQLYADHLAAAITDEKGAAADLRDDVIRAALAGLAVLGVGFVLLERAGRRRGQMLARVEGLLEDDRALAQLEGQLTRALEICDDETAAYGILERAIGSVLQDGGGGELLVADSSLAHLVPAASTPHAISCGVACPAACPAVRRGHAQSFPSSDALDACPHVRERGGDHQTTCVPFTVAGSSVGVLHVTTPGSLPAPTLTHVELIARKTGERVGVARAFAKSEDQARTDPLTGLLNRRSLEERARELVESRRPYAVVFADIDHFKTLNDVHGHEVGDRALRLFSQCLREAVRPADVAARYGGEEFVVVLPDCDAEGAAVVINRLREAMDQRLNSGTVPSFTASFGITDAVGGPLAAHIAQADTALLAAKRAGRNRSVLWTPALGIAQEHQEHEVASAARDEADVASEVGQPGASALHATGRI